MTIQRLTGWACALVLLAGCQTAPGPAPSSAPAVPPSVPTVSISDASATATPSPGATTASPTPAPTPTASKSAVAAGEIIKLEVPEVGFAQPVTPLSSVKMGNAINPPLAAPGRPSVPVRVSDKGVQPSSTANDTTYLGCHTSAKHGADQYPCNVLIRSIKAGSTMLVTTDAGTLTYTVTKTRSIPKGQFASDAETWGIVGKRLVFVVCDIVDGTGNGANWVIYAAVA